MTKYVLNSGQVTRYADKAQKFFTEVLKGVPQECCFLVCLFAMAREDWDLKFSDLALPIVALPEGEYSVFNI